MVSIQPIEDIILTVPQRIKKYLLLYCSEGQMQLQVDTKPITLKAHEVLTITSGQYHQFLDVSKAKGYLLDFTLDFVCKTEKDIELIFQNSLFCHFDYNEVITINYPEVFINLLQCIEKELREKPFQYLNSVHSRIELLLIEVNRSKIANGGEVWKPEALFLRFLELIRNNFDKNLSLGEIAEKLQTTTMKLNELAKIHAGKTAQNVLHGLVISEAKRKLLYENKRVQEIAFELGFQDPYYFSKFFKHHTGISPSQFEKELKS